MARQLPRGQVKQDRSVVNTREPTGKQGTAATAAERLDTTRPHREAGDDAGTNKAARRKPAANLWPR